MNIFQMIGLERTGTNYLQWLIVNNFKDCIIIAIGKHSARMPTHLSLGEKEFIDFFQYRI